MNTLNVDDLRDVTKNVITGYLKYISKLKSPRTDNLITDHRKKYLTGVVRLLFMCLYSEELILTNPAQDLPYFKRNRKIEKEIFGQKEISELLDSIGVSEKFGLRDRACYELLYSSGLRVSEASSLNVDDIDFDDRVIILRQSKFNKDRIIPVNEVAISFLKLYLNSRIKKKNEAVFIGYCGRLTGTTISTRFRGLLTQVCHYKTCNSLYINKLQ